jgi:hypothetical protein
MISSTEGEIMASSKKKRGFSPSLAEQEKFLAAKRVELARKKLEEYKKLKMETDPELANKAKRPGRPPSCDYASTKTYHLKMPEIYYLFLKVKAEEKDVPMRKIILDAVKKVHKKELDLAMGAFS